MPDPKQMSGIPRPVTDLPDGSLSVRLIKGDLSNNIANHPVELHIGDKVQTVNTDEAGRAQFDRLPPGATIKAVATVDGERLESQEFPAPAQGGIRLMLVATDAEKERRKAEEASAPAISGTLVLGQNSQIIIEPSDETLSVFYYLEILNNARAPMNPTTPFVFSTPKGSVGTGVMQGSSPLATSAGTVVTVLGPFPPGATMVQVGTSIPVTSGTVEFSQSFPAPLEALFIVAKKEGDMKLASPQIQRQQDTVSSNTPVIVAAGSALAAGQPLTLAVSGLKHHANWPRQVTLSLASVIVMLGAWGATRKVTTERGDDRKRLIARREKLFQDLVRLEQDHRRGKIDAGRFATRREELMAALENVYGGLDADEVSLVPAS